MRMELLYPIKELIPLQVQDLITIAQKSSYLESIDEIIPLALALIGAPLVPSLPHPRRHNHPQSLVPLRYGEVALQLPSNRDEISGLLLAPLREPRRPPATRRHRLRRREIKLQRH